VASYSLDNMLPAIADQRPFRAGQPKVDLPKTPDVEEKNSVCGVHAHLLDKFRQYIVTIRHIPSS
jgi:hypothetical protein